jgi:hypothetical protein
MMHKLARWLGLLPTLGSTDGVLSPEQYARRERALSNRLRRLELSGYRGRCHQADGRCRVGA